MYYELREGRSYLENDEIIDVYLAITQISAGRSEVFMDLCDRVLGRFPGQYFVQYSAGSYIRST